MDLERLDAMRTIFKRDVMTRLPTVSALLGPVVRDIDLRSDDLFVEYRTSPSSVVHDLRERLRIRIERLYELSTIIPETDRPFCRTVFAYGQYMMLSSLNSATTLASMYALFERERALVTPC